ncbi:hypothetical protein ACQV2E_23525 [Pantoea allii]|uniref:Uncharacterized protein n=1 Tax=Pantoea allii TaxID=574096 RepID=A0ABS6VCP3_9GAMM|nr:MULTISPECIES: hypothetical protein [Pantoea]MBW1213673.1 hypothetical protein [Pantoea allii]MBW1251936.1 hypothetical protein [Pantoea allii]MBW1257084.1 hypothetical protein [Pantoea allii]MBW1260533.1 hypothetical protein [Pantoea allii]MBW1266161.1 hypothetical protein [Pantoea allii]
MTCLSVAKTIYINNVDDKYFKYEIIQDEAGEIVFAVAFIEAIIEHDGLSLPMWTKLENITVDHLVPPKDAGFQTEVRDHPYPGKSMGTVIDVCKEHRKRYKN